MIFLYVETKFNCCFAQKRLKNNPLNSTKEGKGGGYNPNQRWKEEIQKEIIIEDDSYWQKNNDKKENNHTNEPKKIETAKSKLQKIKRIFTTTITQKIKNTTRKIKIITCQTTIRPNKKSAFFF